jgi:hypothetical protein
MTSLRVRLAVMAVVIILAGVALTDVGERAVFNLLIPKQPSAVALHYLDLLASGDVDAVYAKLDPANINNQTRNALEQLSREFPKERRLRTDVVAATSTKTAGATFNSITFQFEYPHKWLLANLYYRDINATIDVIGIHLQPIPNDLAYTNRFTLVGKGPIQYITLALTVVVVLFNLWTLLTVAEMPIADRKWLWIVLALIGFGVFQLNWTSGQHAFTANVQALGGSIQRSSPYYPWIFGVSFPFAIIFWLRLPWIRRHIAAHPEPVTAEEPGRPGERYIGKWNWGAFCMAPFWLMDHGRAWYGIAFLVVATIPVVDVLCIPAAIYCGIRGNAIAVAHRAFLDEAHFVSVQNAWRDWGIPTLVLVPILVLYVLHVI